MKKNKINVAVIGATGNVGRKILSILDERKFSLREIFAIASNNSKDKKVSFGKKDLTVKSLDDVNFNEIDLAFSCVEDSVAKQIIPQIIECGTLVIDKSSYFRLRKDVPLVIPEVNGNLLTAEKTETQALRIIANPNCCVIPIVLALVPLDNAAKIKKLIISTYQSTSGAGKAAMDELYTQTKNKFFYQELQSSIFSKQIAFNLIPQIGNLCEDGYSEEEDKIMQEITKILERKIEISVTSVRVPVFVGHSFSIHVEFENDINAREAEELLAEEIGITVLQDNIDQKPLTPVEIVGEDDVYVSRIRDSRYTKNALDMWITADNLRKGAALNAVQIAEMLFRY